MLFCSGPNRTQHTILLPVAWIAREVTHTVQHRHGVAFWDRIRLTTPPPNELLTSGIRDQKETRSYRMVGCLGELSDRSLWLLWCDNAERLKEITKLKPEGVRISRCLFHLRLLCEIGIHCNSPSRHLVLLEDLLNSLTCTDDMHAIIVAKLGCDWCHSMPVGHIHLRRILFILLQLFFPFSKPKALWRNKDPWSRNSFPTS